MKMKKASFLLIVCILTALICGCSTDDANGTVEITDNEKATVVMNDFVALEVGSFDDIDGGKHTSEYPLWTSDKLSYHQDSSAQQNATVEFNGTTYSGVYEETAVWMPNTYASHQYDGDKVYFDINAETGELTSIMFAYEPEAIATLSEADCRKIADGIADDYIELKDYTVECIKSEVYANAIYGFTYYREISGYETADRLVVSVDGNGKISSFGMNMIGSFNDVEKIVVDSNNAKTVIEDKLNTIYKDNGARTGYDIEDVMLVKLEDGSCAFLYTISNQFLYEYGENQDEIGSLVQLILK